MKLIINTEGIQLMINPPVGPSKYAGPELPPANTGRPIAPINMYKITGYRLSFGLNKDAQRIIPKVCNVMGTGVKGKGKRIWAKIINILAIKADLVSTRNFDDMPWLFWIIIVSSPK